MVEHHLESTYLARLARYEAANPAGYRFLKRLESEGPQHGLWLSTASNAHLYKHGAYLAHLRLEGPKQKASALSLSPKFHQQYIDDVVDRSGLLFPTYIKQLVMNHKGFSQKWASSKGGIDVALSVATSDAFYNVLFNALAGLEVAEVIVVGTP